MEDVNDPSPDLRRDKQCDICSRRFVRSEHLARHRRTHTKEKPFPCPYCSKSFQRSDVKAAHVKKCHGTPYGDDAQEAARGGLGSKRVRIACLSCRRRKMRCNGNEPCAACHSNQIACHYSVAPASSSKKPNHAHGITRELSTQSGNELDMTVDDNDAHSQLPSSRIPHTSSENGLFLNDGTASLQTTSQDVFTLPVQEIPTISIYGTTAGDERDISLSNDDVLYPLADTTGRMNLSQTPMYSTFWFDSSDFAWNDGLFESNSFSDHAFPSSMLHLTDMMQEYFDRKSRAPSPSLNKASKMWYSAQPNLDNHNRDVIRVFLNVFRKHIPDTFPLFKDSALGNRNRAAYTLAMAATGGLFCTVPGSAEVAKSMYNDARRLLLASFHVRDTMEEIAATPQDKLVIVKSFILLELYGLCSGDKRSYEFVEAFHGSLVHAVQEYSHICKAAGLYGLDNSRLIEALHVLDCYRVIIMQRPPSLSWHHFDSFPKPSAEDRGSRFYQALSRLTDGGHISETNYPNEFHLSSLAALCSYLWPATYSRQNRYVGEEFLIKGPSFWKSDFVELACDNWLRTTDQTSNLSSLAVYHMMNIMLHADLTMLQHFAHSTPGSAARDPKKSLVAKDIQAWKEGRHYKIAGWHAEGILASVEKALNASANKVEQQALPRSIPTSSEPRRLPYEAPHVPYAIYYATLVLWCSATTEKNNSSSALIARGERALSLHKVHIAQLLARVLNEVK